MHDTALTQRVQHCSCETEQSVNSPDSVCKNQMTVDIIISKKVNNQMKSNQISFVFKFYFDLENLELLRYT